MEKEFEKLILDKADVLLISGDEQDYQEMLNYLKGEAYAKK